MVSKKPEVGINNINWDGNMGSTAANPGVYIYSLAYKDSNNKNVVISGDITLIK
jgi:hypothetical protein